MESARSMRRFHSIGRVAVLGSLLGLQTIGGSGQESAAPVSHAVTGAPFAAVKSTRIVRIQPDGTSTVVRQEHAILIARDTGGRMLMMGADRTGDQCELPLLGPPPLCDTWRETLFDPHTGVMWHWCDGDVCDKSQLTQIDLHESQITEIERQTTVLENPPTDRDVPHVTIVNLGEKKIEGIMATGIRTVTTQNGANGRPQERIHEVWRSERMCLVVQVIDGDPTGELRISGLSKVSLAPDPALFKAPTNRIVRHWKDGSRFAVDDIANFSQWPARSTGN